MNIYILRHGIAVEPGTPGIKTDADRPLTPEGEQKLKRIGKAMQLMELSFDAILSSPYLRARQTAEMVADTLDLREQLSFTERLASDGDPKKLIDELNGLKPEPQDVLLVGHEPYLSKLIAQLAAGNSTMAVELKKAGLCKLEAEPLHYGRCAVMHWLLTPKQMALMVK